jgi:hypothetical protein
MAPGVALQIVPGRETEFHLNFQVERMGADAEGILWLSLRAKRSNLDVRHGIASARRASQ